MRRYFQIDHDHDYMNRVDGEVWRLLGTHEGSKISHGGSWRPSWPLANVWLGVSAERQQEADERIPDLLATPCAVRFVSAEPLLGPIEFGPIVRDALFAGRIAPHGDGTRPLDWIIVGGESGRGARPMNSDWARSIRDQCADAGVAFFFKQWGEWLPVSQAPDNLTSNAVLDAGGSVSYGGYKLGKSRAGRLLDGREHNDMPKHTKEAA